MIGSPPATGYYDLARHDVLALVPPGTRRLLDVGCGKGFTGAAAKETLGVQEVVGVEYVPAVAAEAARRLDRVLVGDVETIPWDFPAGYFDCIVCADVLEHTRDPWRALTTLRGMLSDRGTLVASLPNLRNTVPILKILTDTFEYQDSGILDRTHLRFFTLHTIRKLFEDTGFAITRIETNRYRSWKYKLLHALSLGFLRPFSIYQYRVAAVKTDNPSRPSSPHP